MCPNAAAQHLASRPLLTCQEAGVETSRG
jgi:hypothetical protein